jgi:hypothetical protein
MEWHEESPEQWLKNARSVPRVVPRGVLSALEEHRSDSNQLLEMRRRIAWTTGKYGDATAK